MKILAALALCLCITTAQADLFRDAAAAFLSQDYATASRLLPPLAEQGNADAQSILGNMYDKGFGIPQDYAEAVKWYRLAAEQGDAFAQCALGNMYRSGLGTPQDYAEALKWYRLAAEQGNANALSNLGVMYSQGVAVPQDYVEAHKWANVAASRKTEEESRNRSTKNRDFVANKMTPGQIAEAQIS
jgi:TPR repeat protein